MAPTKIPPQHVDSFDEEFDVVVVGFGYAGGAAAIAACDGGAKTLLIEKSSKLRLETKVINRYSLKSSQNFC